MAEIRNLFTACLLVLFACGAPSARPEAGAASAFPPTIEARDESVLLDELTELTVHRATSEVLERLARTAPGLRKLELRSARLGSLHPLAGFKRLESLVVDKARFDDLAVLEGLDELKHLDLTRAPSPSEVDLSALALLPRLEVLRLVFHVGPSIDVVLRDLPAMPRLRSLAVTASCGGKADLTSLPSSPMLSDVAVRSSDCHGFALDGIQHTTVAELSLSDISVTSLQPLAEVPSLRRLVLAKLRGVGDGGVSFWTLPATPSRPLWSELPDASEWVDLSALAEVEQLRELEVDGTKVFDLEFLRELPALRVLKLSDMSVVDASAVHDTPACDIAFGGYLVPVARTASDRASVARVQRAVDSLRAFFRRRSCPNHCDQGCSVNVDWVGPRPY